MPKLYYILFTILIFIIIRNILVKKNFTEEFSCPWPLPDWVCAIQTDIGIIQKNIPNINFDMKNIIKSYNKNLPLVKKDLKIVQTDMELSMKIFREVQKLLFDSMKVLQDISTMIKQISEILYLITMKLNFCYKGINESNNKTIEKILEIKQNLNNVLIKISSCIGITPFIGINIINFKQKMDNYIKNCVSGWPNILNIIKTSFIELKNIVSVYQNNPKLFTQSSSTIDGETKDWCKKNINSESPFKDKIKCNQCFNFIAIISEELSELTTIEKFVIDIQNIIFDIGQIMQTFGEFEVLDLNLDLPVLRPINLDGWQII